MRDNPSFRTDALTNRISGGSLDAHQVSWQERMTRMLLWVSVLAWGILLGGKLFDHVVLVGAWSAAPPESLNLLPYGPRFPVDTGDYFFPSSVALLVCSCGVFISAWRTPQSYRIRVFLPPLLLLVILVFTVLWFWPANRALWHVAQGAPDAMQDTTAIVALVHRWVTYDRLRIVAATVGFILCVWAISVPFPTARGARVV